MAEDALDVWMLQQQVHHGRIATDGEDVEIAAGVASAPDAADGNEFDRRCSLVQILDERRGYRGRVSKQMAADILLTVLDRLQDESFLLRAHALQRPEAAVTGCRRKRLNRADVQRRVEEGHGLRTNTLQAKEVEDRLRKLLEELAMVGGCACLGKFANA